MGDKTRGLFGKFEVRRTDGSDYPPLRQMPDGGIDPTKGKHHGCDYFVLDLTHDPFAWAALEAYERRCRSDYPLLAADLKKKMDDHYAAQFPVKGEHADGRTYRDEELIYAATSRCPCGAGLAYPNNGDIRGSWDCSDILTGRSIPKGQEGWKTHTDRLQFAFYEVKSENQPSASGATTRPKP